MVKERIDDLVDILGEEYSRIENTFVIRNSQQLMKYLDDPEGWKAKQIASRISYRKEIIRAAREQLKVINEKTEKVFLLAYKEVDKDNIQITETEIVAQNIPSDVKKKISEKTACPSSFPRYTFPDRIEERYRRVASSH